MKLKPGLGALTPSGQETGRTYCTASRAHMGHTIYVEITAIL